MTTLQKMTRIENKVEKLEKAKDFIAQALDLLDGKKDYHYDLLGVKAEVMKEISVLNAELTRLNSL